MSAMPSTASTGIHIWNAAIHKKITQLFKNIYIEHFQRQVYEYALRTHSYINFFFFCRHAFSKIWPRKKDVLSQTQHPSFTYV